MFWPWQMWGCANTIGPSLVFFFSRAGRAWWHQSAEAETLVFFLQLLRPAGMHHGTPWHTKRKRRNPKLGMIWYDEYGIVNVHDLFAIIPAYIPIYPYKKNPKSSIEERSGWWLDMISVSSEKRFRIATFWFDSWSRSILTLSWTEHLLWQMPQICSRNHKVEVTMVLKAMVWGSPISPTISPMLRIPWGHNEDNCYFGCPFLCGFRQEAHSSQCEGSYGKVGSIGLP